MRFLLFLLITLFIYQSAFAHPGRKASDGCHYCRKDCDKYGLTKGTRHSQSGGICDPKKGPIDPKVIGRQSSAAPTTKSDTSRLDSGSQTYKRSLYGSWRDEDGDCQNTRQEVLIEESLIPVTFKTARQCRVIIGRWYDPYTDQYFTDPGKLDVDHMVPLKEAHESGGWNWDRGKRQAYANDLSNENHLIAVYRGANRSKGAKDPARWMPKNKGYWKEYITIWVEVKRKWGLSMDRQEKHMIESVLSD